MGTIIANILRNEQTVLTKIDLFFKHPNCRSKVDPFRTKGLN